MHVCMYECHMYVWMYVCRYVGLYVYRYAGMYVSMYVCRYVGMYVFMYVCHAWYMLEWYRIRCPIWVVFRRPNWGDFRRPKRGADLFLASAVVLRKGRWASAWASAGIRAFLVHLLRSLSLVLGGRRSNTFEHRQKWTANPVLND